MTLRAVWAEVAQLIVVRSGVDLDLVVQGTAAGVVELLQDVQGRVTRALAVGCIRSNMFDDAVLDSPELLPVTCKVVETAEAKGFLGAVLDEATGKYLVAHVDETS